MTTATPDHRSPQRKALDEQIASEPPLAPLALPSEAVASPVETHLGRLRRPVAVAGIVENGVIRPLDPGVRLPEHSRVIIVTTGTF